MNADPQTVSRLELARQIAIAAGRLTLNYFRSKDLEIIVKDDGSPVTAADQAAETYLRQQILDHFPTDSIVGEEFGVTQGSSGFCWVLDPIDGTKSFVTGVPLYGTMVGVLDQRESLEGVACIGAVHIPGLDEGIYAATGQGAWHYRGSAAPQRASVSKTDLMKEGIV